MRVTDRAEWRVRTTQRRSSFEAHIASCAITLTSRPPKSPIDWDKQIGKPATDERQAAALAKTAHSLTMILAYLPPSPIETDALAEGDVGLAAEVLRRRSNHVHGVSLGYGVVGVAGARSVAMGSVPDR